MRRIRQMLTVASRVYATRAGVALRAYGRRDELALLASRPGRIDPYPLYERLRGRGVLTPTHSGGWATTSHELCRRVLRDRTFGVREEGGRQQDEEGLGLSFLDMDPPDHTRLRRLVAPAFSPRQMSAWAPRIERTVHDLLDGEGRSFDLVPAYARALPESVISSLLGVPHERSEDFARWGGVLGDTLDGARSLGQLTAAMSAMGELETFFEGLFAQRRREPADDLVSAILAAEGEQVQAVEMLPLCVLLLVAGFETTVNLISNTVLALLRHPEQWQAVCADPGLAGAAVEETLRWDPPVQRTSRIAHEDVEVGGQVVRRNQVVLTLIGAANRDPGVHVEPDRFDIARTQHDNLAFSTGIHYCVGQPLARLEATIAVRALAERFPRLALAGRVVRRNSITLRGPLHLPVHV